MDKNLAIKLLVRKAGELVTAAANTDSNSSRIDMQSGPWAGVVFVCFISDSVATGVATLAAEGNSVDSDTGMVALTTDGGETVRARATCAENDDLNDRALIVDVFRPQHRYIQGVRTSTVANIAFGEIWAILYGGRNTPLTEDDTYIADQFIAASPNAAT